MHSIKTVQPGERDQELLKMASIQSQFPVTFKKGMTYTNFEVCCAECGESIKEEDTHGEVVPIQDNMTQVEARAYCKKCNLITPASFRLYSDGRFMGIRNGKWVTYQMRKSMPLWRKVLKVLFW